MKRRQLQLLFGCVLALLTSVPSFAQESSPPAEPQKPSPASVEAARIKAQEKRTALKEKRVQARAEAEKKRAIHAVEVRQKRAAADAIRAKKRVEVRAAVEAKRAMAAATRKLADGTFRLLGSRPGLVTGKIVRGAPYSATAVTEHTQTLGDGNRIIKKNETTFYRDSEGRVRLEQKLKTIGKWNADGDPPSIVTIWDPVAGRSSSLDPRTRTAVTTVRKAVAEKITETRTAVQREGIKVVQPKDKAAAPPAVNKVVPESSGRGRRKESLGRQVIEGVAADGTRSTLTIPAGEIGNVLPIDIVDETWYSPDLQIKVMTRHLDPRSGETVYRVTNINRSEPARSLFEVPADYRVIDRSAPRTPPKKPELPRPATAPAPQKNL